MKMLITAATNFELVSIKNDLQKFAGTNPKLKIEYLVTGIGSVFTTYELLKKITNEKFDLVINIGICGAFTHKLKIGEVIIIEEEQFGDLGIEYADNFRTLFDENFIDENEFPFRLGKLYQGVTSKELQIILNSEKINKVKGLTVNTTHGNQRNIEKIKTKFSADVETMEGAAFFYVCLKEKIPFLQIRAISNYVENRDKSKWNINLALENLNFFIINFFRKLV